MIGESETHSQFNERSRSAPPARGTSIGWAPSRSYQTPEESQSRPQAIAEARACRWPESRGEERRSWLHKDRRTPVFDPKRSLIEQVASYGTPSGLHSSIIDRRRQSSKNGLRFEGDGGVLYRADPRDDTPGLFAAGEESSTVSAKKLTLRFERDGLAGLTSHFDTWFRPNPNMLRTPSWGFDPLRHSLGGAGPAMYGAESGDPELTGKGSALGYFDGEGRGLEGDVYNPAEESGMLSFGSSWGARRSGGDRRWARSGARRGSSCTAKCGRATR